MARFISILAAAGVAFAAAGTAFAEDDATSLSYISYVERYATLRPAHGEETLDAVVNMPVVAGDRLVTSRAARVEIVLADATVVWVDEFSTLDFDALALSRDNPAPRTVLHLAAGAAALELPAHGLGDDTMRLDTPAGTLFLQRPGLYRLDLEGRRLAVQSFSGLAELPSGAGSALLRAGQQARVDGGTVIETRALWEPRDEFWRWVSERRRPAGPSRTAEHLGSRVASRAAILDSYGDWIYVDSYWAWRPRVAITWVPYSYGRWYWTPVGWSWISYEPWGWYPYHYGSWTYHPRYGWLWCWDWVWGPAWVHWFYSGTYIGWCPRGYYDWWYWHRYRYHDARSYPGRWSHVTLDFRGRVYLSEIDLRPWTVVPASHFAHARLDRVRVSPERLRQELPRTPALVRTGPLLTRDLRPGQETFEREFRRGLQEDSIPDLTRVLRRDEGAGGGRDTVPGVRMLPTRDLIRSAERSAGSGDTTSRLAGRGEVGRREGDSPWSRERPPAPTGGGQGGVGTPGRGSGGDERAPLRLPERTRPERVEPGAPGWVGSPGTPSRDVSRPALERPQRGGDPSPPQPTGEGSSRAPQRSAPPPPAPSEATGGRGSEPPPVRPPARSPGEAPGRSSAPPPARPPAESSRPAPPPPPSNPETPPPQARRSFAPRPVGSGQWGYPGNPAGRDAYRWERSHERQHPPAAGVSPPAVDPPSRAFIPRNDYSPPVRSSAPAWDSLAPSRVTAPVPRSAPAPRVAAPSGSSTSSSLSSPAHASRPNSPARPAPSRPER